MMQPRLPGIWYASDRQTRFFHVPDGADPKELFEQLFRGVETLRTTEGGVVANGCFLTTPDDDTFQAITWYGKRLGAWRRDFRESTRAQGIVTARFRRRRFMISTNQSFWFRDLLVEQR